MSISKMRQTLMLLGGRIILPQHFDADRCNEQVGPSGVSVQFHEGQRLSEDELLDWCRLHLAKFQCPLRIVLLQELPIGQSEKADKLALRQRATNMSKT